MAVLGIIRYFAAKIFYASWFSLLDYTNGVTAVRRESITEDSTESCTVEVFSIMDKLPFPEMLSGLKSYILKHESFERPSYILKPNIYLSFLIDNKVYLVEMDPTANPYDTRKFPFFFLSHKELAVKLISMPIDEFIKLGRSIGDPKCDMTWMFHTGRCGSTALCQALNSVEDVTVISEAQHLTNYIAQQCVATGQPLKALLEDEKFEELNIACINFLLKDFSAGQKVCLKTALAYQYEMVLPLIATRYPHHRIVSVHRDGKGGSNSFYRGLHPMAHRLFRALYLFSERTGCMKSMVTEMLFVLSSGMIFVERDLLLGEADVYLLTYSMWLSNLSHFRIHANKFKKIMTILNDDFQANKKEVVTKVGGFDSYAIDLINSHNMSLY